MSKSKKLLAGMITLLVLFVLLLASTITLWYLGIVKQPLFVSLELAGIAIIIGFAAFLFALYINEQRTIREGIKENEYNLHRKVVFYSYNYFSRALSSTLKRHKRRSGYLIVFNAVKTNAITTFTINKTADFNGYIADFILDKHVLGKEYGEGIPFDAEYTEQLHVPFDQINALFEEAQVQYPVSEKTLDKFEKLDDFVIKKFKIAFGNRILKQLKIFIPTYVGCGGSELDGLDFIFTNKILKKFEALNIAFLRDELKQLHTEIDKLFGKGTFKMAHQKIDDLIKLS